MFAALLTLAALVGPPWISIEYPANPMDPTSHNAYLLIHTFHHGEAVDAPLTGEAVTWENGRRRALTLHFETTSRPGVYQLSKQWTDGSPYVLMITVGEGDHGSATALVSVSSAGTVTKVEVPSNPYRDVRVPRAPTDSDLNAAFRAAGGR